jgi:hypothetical protein
MKKNYLLSIINIISVAALAQTGSQVFTSSGTFTVPAGVSSLTIEAIGAGGDGGGNGTGGGGGGGYSMGTFSVTAGSTLSVVVGVHGGGSAATSAVSPYIIATGGDNGVSVPNPTVGGGGAGGVGSGGSLNYTGGTGGGGYWTYFGGGGGAAAGPMGNGGPGGNTIPWTGICMTPGGSGGISLGAPAGDGGKGAGFTDASCNVTDPAGPGLSYGGGGGGGNGNGGGPGLGSDGYVRISWGTTSVAESSLNNLIISPNPFQDKIRISNVKGDEYYQLINALGQVSWEGSNIQEQDFSALKNGIYLLNVRSNNASVNFRIVKK